MEGGSLRGEEGIFIVSFAYFCKIKKKFTLNKEVEKEKVSLWQKCRGSCIIENLGDVNGHINASFLSKKKCLQVLKFSTLPMRRIKVGKYILPGTTKKSEQLGTGN